MRFAESSGDNLLLLSCPAPFSRALGRRITKVYSGRGGPALLWNHFHFHGFPAKEGAQTQPQVIQHERLLSGLEDLRHGGGEGAPSAFLKFQLFAPQPSQFIKLGAAIVLRYSPARGDPVLALQAMERGIQRALLHKQNFAGNLVDALRNRPAVQGLQSDGAENQAVQSALREIDSAVRHSFPYHFYREDSASLVEAQGESRNRACSGMSGG